MIPDLFEESDSDVGAAIQKAGMLSWTDICADLCGHGFQQNTDPYQYAPIAAALNKMDDARMTATKCKFDIAYMIAKEHMAFGKKWLRCVSYKRGTEST